MTGIGKLRRKTLISLDAFNKLEEEFSNQYLESTEYVSPREEPIQAVVEIAPLQTVSQNEEALNKKIAEDKLKTSDETKQLRQKIFISYSHKDKTWLDKLLLHLKPYKLEDLLWEDTKIRPGTDWRENIKKELESAKAAILLVSPYFLASDFILNNELPQLLDAAKNKGLKILWIAVTYSSYDEIEIERYQALNELSNPLDNIKDEVELNKEFVTICKKIKKEITITG